jgi:hypothetical protein
LFAPPPPLHELAPALPPDVAAVIDRAVAIEPDQRPTAAELADALAGAASIPGAGPVALPVAAASTVSAAAVGRPVRWKPWAIGAALVLALVWLASTRGTSPSRLPVAPAGHAPSAGRPTEILATPPPGMDGRQIRDWNEIFDELDRGRFEGARRKLDEFEDNYGETDETRDLRPQLDALGPDVSRGRGGPRGRGKKHRD